MKKHQWAWPSRSHDSKSPQSSSKQQQHIPQLDIDLQIPIRTKNSISPASNPKKKKKPASAVPLLANLSDTKYTVVKNVIRKGLAMKITKDPTVNDWDLFWTDNVVVPQQLARMKPHQKINHFPGMFSLSRKNYLARNLAKMSKMFAQQYDFYPKTWVLPTEFSELKNYMQSQSNPVVIAKPEASCQGKGIFLSKTIQDFQFGQHYVVQKYLKKPLIIDGLKFDLRVYVLVAGCDPLRIYIYNEGLARFATQPYMQPKKQNLNNLFMHLTNYSINKNSDKFQFNQSQNQMDKGHKRSLTSIANNLGKQKWAKIWQGTKDIIIKTLISTQPILKHHYRSCQSQNYANNMCFEILGFDVIIDSNLNPKILQVNYTPSFSTDTPLDRKIKQNLIKDALILMNLTSKAKNESLAEKKKQIMERTLTGKKIWYSKEERQQIVQKLQKKRDQWENKHLGNYEKVFPLDKQLKESQKYQDFLLYSQDCYQNITGANIRRNKKVKPQSNSVSNKQMPLGTTSENNNEKVQRPQLTIGSSGSKIQNQSNLLKQRLKLTNTQNLQKIYKCAVKPMVFKKKRQNNANNKSQSGTIPSIKYIKKQSNISLEQNKKNVNSSKGVSDSSSIVKTLAKQRPNSAAKKSAVNNFYNITFKGKNQMI